MLPLASRTDTNSEQVNLQHVVCLQLIDVKIIADKRHARSSEIRLHAIKENRDMQPGSHVHHSYKSMRSKAWRNAMVAGTNAGLERKLFTLHGKENLWPGADIDERSGHTFTFDVEGIPGIAHVRDAGWNGLRLNVALWPTETASKWIGSSNAGWLAGELFATGWIERKTGAYLTEYVGGWFIRCRANRANTVANISISPNGYADYGRFIH